MELNDQQFEWEKRETDLELKIQQYEEERELIFQAASAAELKKVLPDRNLPIGQQLEVAIRLLMERSRLVSAQELKIAGLEGEVEGYKTKLKDLETKELDNQRHINILQKDVVERQADLRDLEDSH
ncbi:hypothetical protein HK102_012222, partial [Quaeritorhiza haematococci]